MAPRPKTLVGLTIALVRLRYRRQAYGALAVCGALSALALARATVSAPRQAATTTDPRALFEPTLGDDDDALDPALTPTHAGWIVAWSQWSRARGSTGIALRALGRDGAPRGAPQRISVEGSAARYPALRRCGGRVGVLWAGSEVSARWPVHPWFAVVDDDARPVGSARRVSDDEALRPSLDCDGDGWVLGYGWFGDPFRITRVGPDGATRGATITLPAQRDGFGPGTLTALGDLWLVGEPRHDRVRDRSALSLRWVSRAGAVVARHDTPWVPGIAGPLAWSGWGETAWGTWGDDTGFDVRHEPRLMRVEGRAVASPPSAIGPRRSGDVPTLSCDPAGCVAAWSEVVGDDPPRLRVQALTADGQPRGVVRSLGPAVRLLPMGRVALARSLDARELLAAWIVRRGDGLALMTARLTPDGVPVDAPRATRL